MDTSDPGVDLDYVIRYLPVLGLLLLSGHINTGDRIDLPLPHPEAWAETVAWAYTGRDGISERGKENVAFLGGIVDLDPKADNKEDEGKE